MKNTNFFVLDCSVTLSWFFKEKETQKHSSKILSLLNKQHAKVPTIWPLEVANILSRSERYKKYNAMEIAEFKDFLDNLPIYIDDSTSSHAMGSIYTLATTKELSSYDAAYLELAMRENIPLATFDKALQKAAKT